MGRFFSLWACALIKPQGAAFLTGRLDLRELIVYDI